MIHPIITYRSRFFIWWLIWFLFGLGQSLLLTFVTDIGVLASFVDGFSSSVFYSLLAIAIWFPLKQLNPESGRMVIVILNHLFIALATITMWLFGVRLLTVSIVPNPDAYLELWNQSLYYRLAGGFFIYIVITLTYYLIISFDNINKKNINEAKLENMLRETELMMLRSQINPHFLFNSLNSVSSLTITNPDKAREMVVKLSEFMRYALSRKEEKVVPLEKELINMRLYMDIEKVRFGNRLILEENIDKNALDVDVPNMILQPLYENSVKHGVYESVESVVIGVNISRKDSGTTITITNDYDPENIPVRGTGTGLKNIMRRLDLYYNKEAYLLTKKENGKFTAEIFIPER